MFLAFLEVPYVLLESTVERLVSLELLLRAAILDVKVARGVSRRLQTTVVLEHPRRPDLTQPDSDSVTNFRIYVGETCHYPFQLSLRSTLLAF